MGTVPVTRQAETLTAYQLNAPEDMLAALELLVTVGYYGDLLVYIEDGITNWCSPRLFRWWAPGR